MIALPDFLTHLKSRSFEYSSLVFTDGCLKNLFSFTWDSYKSMLLSFSHVENWNCLWSGIQMVVWKPDRKKPVIGSKCPVFKWSPKSCDFTIWIPDTHSVRYSDESGIQVFGILMVTVFTKLGIYLIIISRMWLNWKIIVIV